MINMDVLSYRNLFPADIDNVKHSLLCVIAASCPFPKNSIRLFLKPLVSDKEAPAIISELLAGGYIYGVHTGIGWIYATTAKTDKYFDPENERLVHRKQLLNPSQAINYFYKSNIICAALMRVLRPKLITMGGYPKNPRQCDTIHQIIIDTLQSSVIPFTIGNLDYLYDYVCPEPLIRSYQQYDKLLREHTTQCSYLNAYIEHVPSDKKTMEEYNALNDLCTKSAKEIENIVKYSSIYTYFSGAKVLSFQTLLLNGIFIEEFDKDNITLGIIDNNNVHDLAVLRKRFDYAYSIAALLGKRPHVKFYTRPEKKASLNKYLFKLDCKYFTPAPTIVVLHDDVPSRKEFLGWFLK